MDAVSWWVLFAIVAALAGLAAVVLARRLERPGVSAGVISPADEAELAAIFARVADESDQQRLARLAEHLTGMANRGVPLRWLRAAAGPGRARLGFADGTVVVASSRQPSSFGTLARQSTAGRVSIGRVELDEQSIALQLIWADDAIVVDIHGVDQAD